MVVSGQEDSQRDYDDHNDDDDDGEEEIKLPRPPPVSFGYLLEIHDWRTETR